MILAPTPDVRKDLIICGTTIRKPPEIVAAYLQHLSQQLPIPNTEVRYHFVLDHAEPETVSLVEAFVVEHGGKVEQADGPMQQDFSDEHPQTHQWTGTAMARVGMLKNRILAYAWESQAAAVWLCDADLLCDPGTLRSLWYTEAPIACAVYWTKWYAGPQAPACPQVWLTHPYGLQGNGYPDEASFRAQLLTRQLTRVWGQGACTLLRRRVLEKQVSFAYVDGVSQEGMMAGEDRHFCLRAEAAHLPMIADPWPHIFHVYHPEDRAKIAGWTEKLSTLSVEKPHWLNLHLRPLEPVPTGPNTMGHVPAQNVRVRVGCGQLLPDLEAQCMEHLSGEPFVASVVYPVHYKLAFLRGQRRLLEVTVVDHKGPQGFPVLEEEVIGGIDMVAYTPEQLQSLLPPPEVQTPVAEPIDVTPPEVEPVGVPV